MAIFHRSPKTNGEYRYATEIVGKTVEYEWNEGAAVFKVKPNTATMLSSFSEDYNAGNTMKGYRLCFNDGKTTREYCFIIRGDAAILNKN